MPPKVNLDEELKNGLALRELINKKFIDTSHDISDGGLLIALTEMSMKNLIGFNINVEKIIRQVATARMVGLNCSLKPVHICIGIVVFSKPAKNSTTTTSSKDVTKANNPPDITPGKIRGRVIFINVFTGLLPKLAAALVTLWSNPDKVAVTVITTKGVAKATCARIIPVNE